MESFTVLIPVTLTRENIDDLVETAMDGGYSWFESYGKTDAKDGWFFDHEDVEADAPESFKRTKLTYSDLADALAQVLRSYKPRLSYEDDLSHQIDVNDADAIVQQAIYGEVVFA